MPKMLTAWPLGCSVAPIYPVQTSLWNPIWTETDLPHGRRIEVPASTSVPSASPRQEAPCRCPLWTFDLHEQGIELALQSHQISVSPARVFSAPVCSPWTDGEFFSLASFIRLFIFVYSSLKVGWGFAEPAWCIDVCHLCPHCFCVDLHLNAATCGWSSWHVSFRLSASCLTSPHASILDFFFIFLIFF